MRIARLDGVRGVAIIMVLLHHHDLLNVGWAGVDLFFVLSGFLISRILLQARSQPHYWSTFYAKRACRILPPLIVVLALGILLTPQMGTWSALGYTFFLGNVVDATGHTSYILFNIWSLAVEEHFYLMWPVAILYLRRKWLLFLLCAVICIDPLLRIAFATHLPAVAIYVLTPFRLDGLAAGSLLALLVDNEKASAFIARASGWMFLGAGACFIGLHVVLGDAFSYPKNKPLFNGIGYSLITLIAFSLISYLLLNEASRTSRLFSFDPLVKLGRISYGVYLYQAPVMYLAAKALRLAEPVPKHSLQLMSVFTIPVVIGVSYLSYRFYEKPIMEFGASWTRSFGTPFIAPVAAATTPAADV